MFISKITCSMWLMTIYASASDFSHELPTLTPETFKTIIQNVVFPQDYAGLTPNQARMIIQPQDDIFTFNFNETSYFRFTEGAFLRELYQEKVNKKEILPLPKPFFINEKFNVHVGKQDNSGNFSYNGLMSIFAKDYEFKMTLYVFNDSVLSAKATYEDDRMTISPNVMDDIGFFGTEAQKKERRQNLAGIVKCSWHKQNGKHHLVIKELTVYPYILDSRHWLRIDGLSSDLSFEGIYENDFNLRADRIYDTLGFIARDVLNAHSITVNKKDIHPNVLKNLITVVANEANFQEIVNDEGKRTGIYECKLKEEPVIEENILLDDSSENFIDADTL